MPKKPNLPKLVHQKDKATQLAKKIGDKAVDLQVSSTKHLNKHISKKVGNIKGGKRFVFGWLLLVVLLIAISGVSFIYVNRSSQVIAARDGGTYTEGVVGGFHNLNPLFSSGAIDDSVSRLIFNGLFRYDSEGVLVPDLAEKYTVEEDKKTYIVTLKKNIPWHDGRILNAEDVVFTIKTIQNPVARSTLFASWQGIEVSAIGDNQVKFTLQAPFAPFPNSLTVAILPQHILSQINVETLRTAPFNTAPVGTGPFKFTALRNEDGKQQQLETKSNPQYFRGSPRIDRFNIHTYPEEAVLLESLKNREITAAVDLRSSAVSQIGHDKNITTAGIPLNSGIFAFFNNESPQLKDTQVRVALAEAINRQSILDLFKARYTPLATPLLPTQLGYTDEFAQKTDVIAATKALDAAGWVKQADGIRAKDGQKLTLQMTTVNSAEYSSLAANLQKQWKTIGVDVQPQLLDAEQLQQTALSTHSYDILLYGISMGQDPDVYVYWHSSRSQKDGLNFSQWKSARADSSLTTARTRLEPVLRIARYKTFQDEWAKSAPAVALYQPQVNYSFHENAKGFTPSPSNDASNRLTNVETWTVNTKRVQKTP